MLEPVGSVSTCRGCGSLYRVWEPVGGVGACRGCGRGLVYCGCDVGPGEKLYGK